MGVYDCLFEIGRRIPAAHDARSTRAEQWRPRPLPVFKRAWACISKLRHLDTQARGENDVTRPPNRSASVTSETKRAARCSSHAVKSDCDLGVYAVLRRRYPATAQPIAPRPQRVNEAGSGTEPTSTWIWVWPTSSPF